MSKNEDKKFKPGDKIRRTVDGTALNLRMIEGEIFTFKCYSTINPKVLAVTELGQFWMIDRFELAIPYINEQKLRKKLGLE